MNAAAAPLLDDLLEKEWDAMLFGRDKGLAPMLGWRLCYHTLRSKGSQSGFPDRVLVRDRLDEIATVLGKRWSFEKGLDGRRLLRTELVSYAPQSLWLAGRGRVDSVKAAA